MSVSVEQAGGAFRAPATDAVEVVLSVQGLDVGFGSPFGGIGGVEGVSFTINSGRTTAIVGESGSGKSVSSLALLRLLDSKAKVQGRALFRKKDGETVDLLALGEKELRALRGNELAMIFQEPMTALNPVLRVGSQLTEVLHNHERIGREAARQKALEMLRIVGIQDSESRLNAFPHELSGGMRQRVMIALALMRRPRLLVADEPTTALDVTIQAQILVLLRHLQTSFGMGLIFVTHDLGVVRKIADDVVVMYSGRIVESGPVDQVLESPLHPYTRGLLNSAPFVTASGESVPLTPIPGLVPSPAAPPSGCRFHPRCDYTVSGLCDGEEPPLETAFGKRQVRCARWQQLSAKPEAAHV